MLKRKSTSRNFGLLMGITFAMSVLLLLPVSLKAQPTPTPTPWVKPVDVEGPVRVRVSVMAPQIVSDTFGKRVAQNFVAIQVTIANHDKDYQYLINDVSLYLNDVFTPPPAGFNFFLSSAELSLLRGVAEKGQGQDTRNKVLRIFRGIGTVAAGLIGVAGFGPSYGEAVAVFNGPVINAYSEAFPDYTINQMNRLNDSAYKANTLVPQKHSKVIVAFIPQSIFLNKQQRNQFWKDPTALYPAVDFRRVQAYIDGDHITEVTNIPPVISNVTFESSELLKFGTAKPIVKGSIVGNFLSGASVDFGSPIPEGILSIAKDGESTSDRLNFIIKASKPVPPGTDLNLVVSNAQGTDTRLKELSYMPDPPTLDTIGPATGAQDSEVTATLTGTNFIPGVGQTRVLVSGGDVEVSDPFDVVGTSMKVTITIKESAATTTRRVTVVNDNSASAPKTFTITPKPPSP